jgi:hypothetical protein
MTSLGQQWLTAAEDLRVRVTAPFALITGLGERVEFDAMVHGFGSPKGMLLRSLHVDVLGMQWAQRVVVDPLGIW